MCIELIKNNPYRILGVLSNSPLKDRVGNQNRLAAFAKVGKETTFPNDFTEVITEKPQRTAESISAANTALNLDKNQLKHSFFWFIKGGSIDEIALKHLQSGNLDKAKELFLKQETYSSLINLAVIAFIQKDAATGFGNISKVIHNDNYRANLLEALGINNLIISENELSEIVISDLLKEVSAKELLSSTTNQSDKEIISKSAIEEPLSKINSAIATAKSADNKNSNAQLEAGTKLMNSTKVPLKTVKDIAGASSPQYQMVADNVAKQVLQCGINYYNNAPDSDVESPRKAMVLQEYALKIAVGKLTKDRCQENYDVLKKAVDNMPPTEVALEARKIHEELRKFCQLPDKISHSVTLLNNTKPLLQTIKMRLGATNSFYLSLSTQVVSNALHNIIEEVNQAQNAFGHLINECKRRGINPSLVGSTILDTIKPVLREAWQATLKMDSFDMEYEFKTKRYNPNRQSLKEMCDDLGVSTYASSLTSRSSSSSSTTRTTSTTSRPTPSGPSSSDDGLPIGCWVAIIIAIIIFLCNVL